MQVFIYINELGVPMLFRDLDQAKSYAESDAQVDEDENPQWGQVEDRLSLHVRGRFSPIAVMWERYL